MPSSDPFDSLVSEYASIAGDFAAQRKRLREARMKWIEENECPTSYTIDTTDKDGKVTKHATPFQVGKIQYPDIWTEDMKVAAKPLDEAAAEQMFAGIEAVTQASASEEPRLTILIDGDKQTAFLTGSKVDVSPHPAIEEGEDYGEYYERVSRSYQRQAAASGAGGPVAGNDGLRQSAAVDSPGGGRTDAPGDSSGECAGPVLDRHTDALRLGDGRPASSSDDASPPAAATVPNESVTPAPEHSATAPAAVNGGSLPEVSGE